jgi:hypothetical protein
MINEYYTSGLLLLLAICASAVQSTNLISNNSDYGAEKILCNCDKNLSESGDEPFVGSFDLVATHTYSNGNSRNDTFSFFFGHEKTAILIHAELNQPDLRMVFNPGDSSITALFEIKGNKSGYILPMNEKYWPGMRYALRPFDAGKGSELNSAGDTKILEGFLCRKMLSESNEYNAELWIAEGIPLTMQRVLSYQTVGAGKSQHELEQFEQFGVEGLPLEMHLTSKTGKADVIIRLINFRESVDDSIFSIEGHSVFPVD